MSRGINQGENYTFETIPLNFGIQCLIISLFYFKNLPGKDNTGAMTVKELVDLLATIIWQASAGHATLHNPQYTEFAYPLNYPLGLELPPPRSKVHLNRS